MKPIKFDYRNCVYAEDQPEYLPLPAHKMDDGTVISCWKLTDEEIQELIKTKKLYISQLTFNEPLQPILPQVESPFKFVEKLPPEFKYKYGDQVLVWFDDDPNMKFDGIYLMFDHKYQKYIVREGDDIAQWEDDYIMLKLDND